jgi:peptidoglycan hydrolase-like protein with peptidoglycan-binding domain
MNSGPTLQIGSTGPDVRRLQILFVMTKLLDYNGIDGHLGPQTQDAVKSFQQSSNLTVDGVDQRPGTLFPRIRTRRSWRAAQLAMPYPHCRKRWRPTAALIRQRIPGPSMGILAQRPNRRCARIKRTEALQRMEPLAIRPGGFRQGQPAKGGLVTV